MENKEFILGVQRISEKHYKRDVLIRIPKYEETDFQLQYIRLNESLVDTSIVQDTYKNIVIRGLHDYIRGSFAFSREQQKEILTLFDFKEIFSGRQKFEIGLSPKAREDSFAYKQAIQIIDDSQYFLMRLNFKSDNKYIQLDSTHLRDIVKGKDGILDNDLVYKKLKNQIIDIVQDTLFLFSLYKKTIQGLTEKDYQHYFELYKNKTIKE